MNAQELTTLNQCYVCQVLVSGDDTILVDEDEIVFKASVCQEHANINE